MKLSMVQVESRINSMMHSAKLYKSEMKSIQIIWNVLHSELSGRTKSGRRKNSVFLESFAFGYYLAKLDELKKDHEFCYKVNGILYSTYKNSCHDNAEVFYNRGSEFMDSLERGFYWKNSSCYFA